MLVISESAVAQPPDIAAKTGVGAKTHGQLGRDMVKAVFNQCGTGIGIVCLPP